ncbi:hypothetical protein BH11PSE8_BH11PSE8_33100 [soil metagenome]
MPARDVREADLDGECLIDRLRLLPSATERSMSSGETLHAAGEPFERVSLPMSGCFKVVSRSASGPGRIIGLHLRGDWIAMDAMVSGWHAADVIAVGSARVLSIEQQAFEMACRHDEELFVMVRDSIGRVLALTAGDLPRMPTRDGA